MIGIIKFNNMEFFSIIMNFVKGCICMGELFHLVKR